jgi:cell division transport system ATP-binding protein
VIRLRGVTLTYPNGTRALDGVDLDIEKGSFVFLVGHSGTGKSSLLKLMYREQVPTSGEVTVDGIRVDTLRRGRVPKLRRNIGVVFQDFKLLSHKTV